MTEPRVLFFDIETSPLQGYAWGTYDTNLIAVTEEWHLLSVAWKWAGDKTVQCETTAGDPADDFALTCRLQELFDAADVVVAHNAVKFDVPKANARMAYWELDPPSHYRIVDTLTTARKHFAFTSNKLDDLCGHLGIGRKLPHAGFAMWRGCMADDPKAWRQMERYNKHDVRLLEKLYQALRPWSANHPNLALIAGEPECCPKCLAPRSELIVRGYRHNQVTSRQQFQCKRCHSYCYGRAVVKSPVKHVT